MMSDYRTGLVVRNWSMLRSLVLLWLVLDDGLGRRGDCCVGGFGVRGHLVRCLVRCLDNVVRHECLSVGYGVVHSGHSAQWLETGLRLALEHISVILQVVIAGQVMLAIVLLCKRLVVPSLMVILVVHLWLNVVLLVHSPGVHRGAFFFVEDWLVLTVCDDLLNDGVGVRMALAAIER